MNSISHLTVALVAATVFLTLGASVGAQETGENGDGANQAPVMDGLTGGDAPWERAYDEAMLDGRKAYNSEQREAARDAFVRAIQILPNGAAAYRNLARNYNFMGRYPEATEFYDHYLRLAPDADDRDVIREERRGTASRAGDEPWSPPASQRMALRALERELKGGRALTGEDGGAWGMYLTLLETGYVAPDLRRLQRDLKEELVEELEAYLEPRDGFLPVLSVDEWGLQGQRLDALQTLVRSEEDQRYVERRRTLVTTVRAVVDESSSQNLEALQEAIADNDDLPYASWYYVIALKQADQPAEALTALDAMLDDGVFDGEALIKARVVRAQLHQQMGDVDEALRQFQQILDRHH